MVTARMIFRRSFSLRRMTMAKPTKAESRDALVLFSLSPSKILEAVKKYDEAAPVKVLNPIQLIVYGVLEEEDN